MIRWLRWYRFVALPLVYYVYLSQLCSAQDVPHETLRPLRGPAVRVPESFIGHPTILVLGYSSDAIGEARVWNKVLAASSTLSKNVDVYQVAVVKRTIAYHLGFTTLQLRLLVARRFQPRYFVVTDRTGAWHQFGDSGTESDAHVVVLNSKGHTCWKLEGSVSQDSLAGLREAIPICLAIDTKSK